jgi:PAS domain S-box-containing protein
MLKRSADEEIEALREALNRERSLRLAQESEAKARAARATSFRRALVELARSLSQEPQAVLDSVVEKVAEVLGVERVSVWEMAADRSSILCRSLFVASSRTLTRGLELKAAAHPRYFAALEDSRALAADDARADPRTSEFRDGYLVPLGITSMLDVAIRLRGRLAGVLCHEHVGPARSWSPEEEDFASSAADLLALAFEEAELRRSLARLQEAEERYRSLVQNLPVGVYSSLPNPSGTATFVSDRWREWTGYDAVEMAEPETWARMLHPDDRERVLAAYARACAEGTDFDVEYRILPKDHRPSRHVHDHGTPVKGLDGRVLRFDGVVMDISATKRALAELRESEARFRTMADHAPVMIWVTEADGRCVFLSKSWYEFTGQSVADGLGFGWLDVVHPEDRLRVEKAFREAVERREPFRAEYRLRRMDGSYRWALDTSAPRISEGAPPLGYIGSVIDITDRKAAEEAIQARVRERTAELEAANKELEAFSYSVSHDLRAPIRTIRGLADFLREDLAPSLGSEGLGHVKRIADAADRMDRLVNDLLSYSRQSRAEIALRDIDPGEILNDVLSSMAGDLSATKAVVERDPQFPRVLADRAMLFQALANLISNAIKFTRPGVSPKVRVRGQRLEGRSRIWVEDDGIGIAPEHQAKLFRVFERLVLREDYPGTGIGLATVRRVVGRMGGTCGVESAAGSGSRFWIELADAP